MIMSNCESCKQNCEINPNDVAPVPYIVYDMAMARSSLIIRKLIVALMVAFLMFVGTNIAWLYAWSSYDYESERTVVEALDGVANYIGEDGVIANGTDYRS